MLPVVAGAGETKRQMLLYTLMLCGRRALMPWLLGIAGPFYAVCARRAQPPVHRLDGDPGLARRHRAAARGRCLPSRCFYLFPDFFTLLLVGRDRWRCWRDA